MKKANKTLGILIRNLKDTPRKVREIVYNIMVCPHKEYCGAKWDPYMKVLTNGIERVQYRTAGFILKWYHNTSSIIEMINQMG